MEFIAWSNHKYIMHGFLWRWHVDHHRNDRRNALSAEFIHKRFEKNDLFFLVYALPAIALMVIGFSINYLPIVFISLGITLYGLTYFIIHDIVIHKRLPISFMIKKPNRFLQAIIKAHMAHHWPKSKTDFQNYGLLVFPVRFFNS